MHHLLPGAVTDHPKWEEWSNRSIEADLRRYGIRLCLHHYSTYAGFTGIVSTRTIRATDTRFLNDPAELTYGLAPCLRALAAVRHSRLRAHALLMARALYERFGFTTFVASFSERDDLPSQWEDYADGGKGFAIGIDGRCVTGLWAGETALRLMPVEYNEKVQRERANEAVGRAVADIIELGGISSRWIEDTLRARFSQLAVDLLYMCATYKAARWADEREWRLLYHHNGIGAGLPVEIDRYSRLPKPFVSIDLTRTIDGRPRPIFEAVRVGARVHSIVCAHAEKMLAGEQPRVRWSRQRA